jgi:uncharacterized protein YbjT (DUF2867 family)
MSEPVHHRLPEGPVLVLGATGKTGRRVAQRLLARGVPVRPGSRSADPPFDWDDRATWAPALEGASAAYVTFVPDLAVPGAPEAIGAFARTALAAGCRRLVLLSGRGEAEAERAERFLAGSGAAWTVLRCSWFLQNFSEGDFAGAVAGGELALPAGERRAPFVDADDIADVAVAALCEPGHEGRTYELTGPRALTHAEVVAEIARATGRPARYVPIGLDAFAAGLVEQGVPPEVAGLLRHLFEEVLVEANAGVTGDVRAVLGREPRDVARFAHAAARAGAWDAAPVVA